MMMELIEKLMGHDEVTHAFVIQVAEIYSSDFHILDAILRQQLHQPYNEAEFAVLWSLGVLAEMNGHIESYEADVALGRYNTYRMFVKLYGTEAPHHFKATQAQYEALFEERLAQLPEVKQKRYLDLLPRYKQDYPLIPIPIPIIE